MNKLLAVFWLRRRLAVHSIAGLAGAVNVAAGGALAAAAAVGAVAIATALGVIVHLAAATGDTDTLRSAWFITASTVTFFALGVPIIVGAGQREFDPTRLLRFPMSSSAIYNLSLASDGVSRIHLAWYPALAAAAIAGLPGAAPGITSSILLLGLFAAVLVCWSHTLLLVVRRLLRHRRFREIGAIVGLTALVAVCLFPAAIDLSAEDADRRIARLFSVPDELAAATSLLPPSITAEGLVAAMEERHGAAAAAVLGLALWLATGWATGWLIFNQLLRSDASPGPGRGSGATIRARFADAVFSPLPTGVATAAAREMRYLLRSGVGKLSLLIMPVMAALPAVLAGRHADLQLAGFDLEGLVFAGMMLYTASLTGYLQVNAFAWDRTSLTAIFSYPISTSQVIFGKNIAHWVFNLALAVEAVLVWTLVRGMPAWPAMLGGFLVFATATVLLSLIGNLTSIAFPVARPVEAITSAASPVGTLVVIGCLLTGAASLGISSTAARAVAAPGLQPVLSLGFFGAVIVLYRAFLGTAARTLHERRDDVLHALGSV